jgi:hypothetical protein
MRNGITRRVRRWGDSDGNVGTGGSAANTTAGHRTRGVRCARHGGARGQAPTGRRGLAISSSGGLAVSSGGRALAFGCPGGRAKAPGTRRALGGRQADVPAGPAAHRPQPVRRPAAGHGTASL